MWNSCKFARDYFCRQKYMQFTGKNTKIAGKNTHQTQAKITANAGKNTRKIAGKKNLQFHAESPAIAGRQSALTPRINSPANCR